MRFKFLILMIVSTLFLMACADDRYSDLNNNASEPAQKEEVSDPLLDDHLDEAVEAIEALEAIGIE